MLNDELVTCCKRLRLSRTLADTSDFAKDQTPEEYLLYVLTRELEHREKNRRDRLLKAAGFHSWKTFDNYRFDDIKLPAGVTPEYLAKAAFVEEKKNLILYGNVGTGKTHLATAIGIEACRRGLRTGFYRTAHLVNRLSEAKKEGKLGKLVTSLGKLDLLICDEWGYVPLDREAAQLLFQIISDSYEQRSVIITTNLEFSRWVGIFYDEQMTAAMIDRLIHHGCLLLFDGPSNRVRESLMRQGG